MAICTAADASLATVERCNCAVDAACWRSNLSGDRGVGYRLAGDLYARLGHVKARGDLVGYNFSHGLHAVNGVCWTRGVTRLKRCGAVI